MQDQQNNNQPANTPQFETSSFPPNNIYQNPVPNPINRNESPAYPVNTIEKINNLAIFGFVASFLIPVAGLIISIMALNDMKSGSQRGRGLAIAGVVISSVFLAIALIAIIAIIIGGGSESPSYRY